MHQKVDGEGHGVIITWEGGVKAYCSDSGGELCLVVVRGKTLYVTGLMALICVVMTEAC